MQQQHYLNYTRRQPRREVEMVVRAQLLHTTAMYQVLEFIARLARAACLH
ncbi:hypothetical protein KC887_02595 [Candidatus Kaiserbacteria bacterium]|nr:hypothetical protein [Candidatus Kaiserbacteria bacterium]